MVFSVGIIGLGDIALRRHVPVIERNEEFQLLATASQRGIKVDGVQHDFRDYREMLQLAALDAVAICTPPDVRFAIARDALLAGKHILLEKPSTATLGETLALARIAADLGKTIFTTWHSQENLAVDRARDLLAGTSIRRLEIRWHEDVNAHHAGQRWIWQSGGFGVFDAGINPLSIATAIAPRPLLVRAAELHVPQDAQTPAIARLGLEMDGTHGDALHADLDWLRPGNDKFIKVETSQGQKLELRDSGGTLLVDGEIVVTGERREYDMLYERFARLLKAGASHVDVEPLRIVADAYLVAERHVIGSIMT